MRRRPPLVALTLLAAIALMAPSSAQVNASKVKAAFVMNFLKFVEWPVPRPESESIVVSVLGDGEFAAVLTEVAATQSVNGRAVRVRAASHPTEARDAHLMFIGGSQSRNLPAVLRTLEGEAVLTIGDTEGFAQSGVIINLYTFDQRVLIEVNTTAAARARLRLSAHLLRLARIVG